MGAALLPARTSTAAAATVGSTLWVTDVNMSTGRVCSSGDARNTAITTSSKDQTKANNAPARTPGAITGKVTWTQRAGSEAPRLSAALSRLRSCRLRAAETGWATSGMAVTA